MASNEDFLAEMERRRKAAEQGAPAQTPNEYNQVQSAPYVATATEPETNETGIIGFLIRKGIAADKGQANAILIGVMVVVIALLVWINWPQGSAPVIAPPPGGPGSRSVSQ